MKVVIYKNENGGVSVIYPVLEVLDKYGIEAIAKKDVPSGLPYKIINSEDLPNRLERSQWDIDINLLNDGFGGVSYEFN